MADADDGEIFAVQQVCRHLLKNIADHAQVCSRLTAGQIPTEWQLSFVVIVAGRIVVDGVAIGPIAVATPIADVKQRNELLELAKGVSAGGPSQ